MRTTFVITSALILSLILVSCGSPAPDLAAIKKTVEEFNAASKDAMMSGNMDKVMAYYEDNAMQLPSNSVMLKGKDAIRGSMDQMMKSGMKVTNASFTTTELDASGIIAFEVGAYEMTMSIPNMGETKDKGKYLTIWKQQQDGAWKVHAETWNSDLPVPTMEKAKAKKQDTKKAVKKEPKKVVKKDAKKSTKMEAKKPTKTDAKKSTKKSTKTAAKKDTKKK